MANFMCLSYFVLHNHSFPIGNEWRIYNVSRQTNWLFRLFRSHRWAPLTSSGVNSIFFFIFIVKPIASLIAHMLINTAQQQPTIVELHILITFSVIIILHFILLYFLQHLFYPRINYSWQTRANFSLWLIINHQFNKSPKFITIHKSLV